jgi:glycosyltransferase involved in cell wall biosynthesis
MNLAIIIPFLEKYGGAERFVVECVRVWQHRYSITLYATSISEDLLLEHGIGPGVVRRLLSPYFEGEHSMFLNAVLLPRVWRDEIGRHDLYHTHLWPTHLVDLHPMVWYPHEPFRVLHDLRHEQTAERVGSDVIRHVHVYPKYTYDAISGSLYEAYLGAIGAADRGVRPERVVANSRYTARYLESVYGAEVADVVYPGVSPGAAVAGEGDEADLFITICQLWSHKRVHLLIEAVALTASARLLVIGSGPERERLQALVDRLGLQERVRIESGLSNAQVQAALARARGFVFAPVKEPFGIVVLEAMAAGKPVVAIDEGGYSEVCTPANAFLVPASPAVFAEKMELLQQDAALAAAMGAAGRETALAYAWEHSAAGLGSLLEKTLEESTLARAGGPSGADPGGLAGGPGGQQGRPLLGAQYYLWYGEGYGAAHWGDTARSGGVADVPLLGYYGSTKGQTIGAHLDLMEGMGLDFAVLNLHLDEHGINGLELMGIRHLFDIAAQRNTPLRFAVQLAPYTDRLDDVAKAVATVEKLFGDHPHYLRLDGRPVLFWFWSTAWDGRAEFFERVAPAASRFTNMAASLRLPDDVHEDQLTFGFFEGFVPFSPLELSDSRNWHKVWSAAYHAAEQAGMRWRVAALSPGYDDSGLDDPQREGNPYRSIARHEGAAYREGMHFIQKLARPPHLVMISTFNEFHENTHIEPSQRHGTVYADMTREFAEVLKTGLWNAR